MFNRLHAEHFADRAREVYDESRDFARRGAGEANTFIHSQPMAATLLAVGAGLLMGMIYPRGAKAAPAVRKGRGAAALKSKKRARA
jgi:hypothetical protein